MAANHKLRGLIKGEAVKDIASGQGAMSITFDDVLINVQVKERLHAFRD